MVPRVIDWDSIHRRLATTACAISGNLGYSPEEVRKVLETRARALAGAPAKPDDAERFEILAFTLAGESYGIETRYVREVCPLKDLTSVPCTPPFIAGVMNLRGQILAIVDLRKFFELPARGLTELNRVIVLRSSENEFGLLADSIEGMRPVTVSTLQKSLPTLTGIREKYLKGVTSQMLAVLDGRRLLMDDGLKVNEKIIR